MGPSRERAPQRPLPAIDLDNAPFWEAVQDRRLVVQRCADCGTYQHPPTPMCGSCNSFNVQWVESDGMGTVHSWIVVNQPSHPFFTDVPYNVVLVELKEGIRLFSNLLDVAPNEIREGMEVRVDFVEVEEGVTLYQFRPAER